MTADGRTISVSPGFFFPTTVKHEQVFLFFLVSVAYKNKTFIGCRNKKKKL